MEATATLSVNVDKREERWADFLRSLAPWELHKFTLGDMELIAHDEYVLGVVTLAEVRLTLSFEESREEE